MKTIFRKAMTVLGSAALVGATMGSALAASYPSPFTSDSVVVVGANAAQSDNVAASRIVSNLDAANAGNSMVSLSGGAGVTENEVALGGTIVSGDIKSTMDEGEIPSLLDETLSWDDGTGAEDYDFHEEIRISGMTVLTTLDDEDFEGIALTNDEGLHYRYVFDEALDWDAVGSTDADDLYLTILGKQYEVSSMNNVTNTITVVTSEEVVLSPGESVTVDGVTFTLDDLSSTAARINGEVVTTSSKKIDGLRVQVKDDSIFYNENAPDSSSVTLQIGEDISESFTTGDEYIGEDEDDPLWVWSIDLDGGYIGVSYKGTNVAADDDDAGDSVKYVGDSFVMPEGFAAVSLDAISERDYEDITVSFSEDMDLFNGSATDEFATGDVAVISIPEGSYSAANNDDTTELYLYYNGTGYGEVQMFYKDIEGEYTPTNEARWVNSWYLNATTDLSEWIVEDLEVGDTLVNIALNGTGSSGATSVSFYIEGDSSDYITVSLGDDVDTDGFIKMGATIEDADASDVVVGASSDLSTIDEGSIMTSYGVILSDGTSVEDEVDADELTLSIPDDQVYATISVLANGELSDGGDAGVMTVTDAEAASMDANMVVVGGSAINSIAADLLGGAYREAEFTEMTDVAAGEALIQSFSREGNTALLVAGYNAEDTDMAVTYLLNEDVDTSVGTKMKVMSATEATVVTA